MPEWRKDPVVDRWVVIATERGKRPSDYRIKPDLPRGGRCPLCPGHEHDTPPEVLSFRDDEARANQPGWWVRVVPNKFPAVRVEGDFDYRREGVYDLMNGLGAHEVVVEATGHDQRLEEQSNRQVEEVVWAWQQRSLDLRRDIRLKYIQIFKNYGQVGGASLEHPHSQIIALPIVPADVRGELAGTQAYQREYGGCVYCNMLCQELSDGRRMVVESEHFLVFVPFAARFPFEMWILPREHQGDFGSIRVEQVADLARVIRLSLGKLNNILEYPPYNMFLHTAPVNSGDYAEYHWHLEILPRLTIMAGFELATGYVINPTPPEMAAAELRDAVASWQEVGLHSNREVTQYV